MSCDKFRLFMSLWITKACFWGSIKFRSGLLSEAIKFTWGFNADRTPSCRVSPSEWTASHSRDSESTALERLAMEGEFKLFDRYSQLHRKHDGKKLQVPECNTNTNGGWRWFGAFLSLLFAVYTGLCSEVSSFIETKAKCRPLISDCSRWTSFQQWLLLNHS